MKRIAVIVTIIIVGNVRALAQEYASAEADLRNRMLWGFETAAPYDSLLQAPKRKLLPSNMSVIERTLWDENGIFRSTGLAAPLTPEVRKSELQLRRTMLTAHQIGGFVTLGLMGTAAYFGQKIIDGQVGYRRNHQIFVTATIISYSGTALLALLSPPPIIRRDEISTISVHKAFAWVHIAGMILTPMLAPSLRRGNFSDQAHIHQIAAYITIAAMAGSLISVTF